VVFKERFLAAELNDGALCEVLMMWMDESGRHKPVDGYRRRALLKLRQTSGLTAWQIGHACWL